MAAFKNINRIVIAGVGLIGGSVGLALKRAKFDGEIIGLGRRISSLQNALDVGAVDHATLDYAEALKGADILLIGTPVDVIPTIVENALKHTQSGCIITDVGSTKARLITQIKRIMPLNVHFVGAHPMAGSHETGVKAAYESLFDNSVCIITPTESTSLDAVKVISGLWKLLGARVELMPPKEHDFLISAASHLPHAVACALVSVVAGVESNSRKAVDFAATGFADTTRIAAGSPEVWKSILLHNADVTSDMLARIEKELAELRKLLDSRNEEGLMKKLTKAKQIRDSFQQK